MSGQGSAKRCKSEHAHTSSSAVGAASAYRVYPGLASLFPDVARVVQQSASSETLPAEASGAMDVASSDPHQLQASGVQERDTPQAEAQHAKEEASSEPWHTESFSEEEASR